MESSDFLIFWAVVGLRFLVPLLIPRYPLPAVIACLIIDGVDQTIFQQFTSLPLEGYQSYDKALDIYYQTIAYISTLRNWADPYAYSVGRFLFYYRLLGVVLFEYTQQRALLLIFPNTFEYFFIYYEAYRLRWNPLRMSRRLVLGAAAFIWIFIKLPQEYWIHIAQVDTTDFIKEDLLGVPADTPFPELVATFPGLFLGLAIVIVLLVAGVWWLLKHKLPPADWKLSFEVDSHQPLPSGEALAAAQSTMRSRILSPMLLEKIAMISLVGTIFGMVLQAQATFLQLILGVGIIVTINTAVSHWFARRGHDWASIGREFVAMSLVNIGLVIGYSMLLPQFEGSINRTNTLFFALLLTLLVTLYDRYYPVHAARVAQA